MERIRLLRATSSMSLNKSRQDSLRIWRVSVSWIPSVEAKESTKSQSKTKRSTLFVGQRGAICVSYLASVVSMMAMSQASCHKVLFAPKLFYERQAVLQMILMSRVQCGMWNMEILTTKMHKNHIAFCWGTEKWSCSPQPSVLFESLWC